MVLCGITLNIDRLFNLLPLQYTNWLLSRKYEEISSTKVPETMYHFSGQTFWVSGKVLLSSLLLFL